MKLNVGDLIPIGESIKLPIEVDNYHSIAQWSDILIPNENRGKALLEFLLTYKESSIEIASSKQAITVIMEENTFNKDRQVPFDYDQVIFKIGKDTEVGKYLAWIEELLANHIRGIEKLELGLIFENTSLEIAKNKHALRTIMYGEQLESLTNYRLNLVNQEEVNYKFNNLNKKIKEEVNNLNKKIESIK